MIRYQAVVTGMYLVASLVTALYLCGQFAWLALYGHPKPREESVGYRILVPLNSIGVVGGGTCHAVVLTIVGASLLWSATMTMFAVHVGIATWIIWDLGNGCYQSDFEGGGWMTPVNQHAAHQNARVRTVAWLLTGLVAVGILVALP